MQELVTSRKRDLISAREDNSLPRLYGIANPPKKSCSPGLAHSIGGREPDVRGLVSSMAIQVS